MRTFTVWFPIFASAVIIAVLAVVAMPEYQSGPGALTAFALIPNLIILGLCAVVAVACIARRPRPLIASPRVALVTVGAYLLFVCAAFFTNAITSYCDTKFRVVDWSNKTEKHANGNMHFHTIKNLERPELITVYVPSTSSDDANPYDVSR